MSYKAYQELLAQEPAGVETWPAEVTSAKHLGEWRHEPDEAAQMARVPRQNAKQVIALLDAAHREGRLPTHGELDRIVSLVSVSGQWGSRR